MAKIDSLIHIINLLYHRQVVTLRQIVDTCGISERSAYRYLNAISEANVPLYFDRKERGYRLSISSQFTLGELGLDEGVTLALALNLLRKSAGPTYRARIDDILAKVYARQAFGMEEISRIAADAVGDVHPQADVDHRLTLAIIQVAIHLQRGLSLELERADGQVLSVSILAPALEFSEDWRVIDRAVSDAQAIEISAIRTAQIT